MTSKCFMTWTQTSREEKDVFILNQNQLRDLVFLWKIIERNENKTKYKKMISIFYWINPQTCDIGLPKTIKIIFHPFFTFGPGQLSLQSNPLKHAYCTNCSPCNIIHLPAPSMFNYHNYKIIYKISLNVWILEKRVRDIGSVQCLCPVVLSLTLSHSLKRKNIITCIIL